ncbi:MAG: RIP metalloprotease RseP [Candidatus Zixiibacteriota bacterium]|nr:MAG: RIP metalloprotease RseP [candidate division Zixibacteria bacterium]
MITTVLATVFVLGVLVFFHELGHFLVAKRAGIRVHRFSLGFPPTVFSKKWGETEYAIGLIPLGGYVKMAGDNPAEETKGEPWEFMSKPVWKRFLVIIAGPFMNFVLAVMVLSGLYFFRGQEVKVYVSSVEQNSPAENAGIVEGDQILSVNGIRITTFNRMALIIEEKVEEPVVVSWQHADQILTDTIVTYADYARTVSGDTIIVGKIGIGGRRGYETLGFFASISAGFDKSVLYVRLVASFVWGLITRQIDAREIGGPIIISKLAGVTARDGFDILMEFLALLSVNLAVLNILPIPVFDGGHLLFLFAEKIKGSPVSLKTRILAQQIGIAFILLLVIFVTFNDISRWNMFR